MTPEGEGGVESGEVRGDFGEWLGVETKELSKKYKFINSRFMD